MFTYWWSLQRKLRARAEAEKDADNVIRMRSRRKVAEPEPPQVTEPPEPTDEQIDEILADVDMQQKKQAEPEPKPTRRAGTPTMAEQLKEWEKRQQPTA